MVNTVTANAYQSASIFASQTVPALYAGTSVSTKMGGGVCALVATEMAMRALSDAYNILRDQETDHREIASLLVNLIGSVTMGGCALNLVPGAPLLGCVGFVAYSILFHEEDDKNPDPYFTAKLIGIPLEKLYETTLSTLTLVANAITTVANLLFDTLLNVICAPIYLISLVTRRASDTALNAINASNSPPHQAPRE